jgi:hypothetical protein
MFQQQMVQVFPEELMVHHRMLLQVQDELMQLTVLPVNLLLLILKADQASKWFKPVEPVQPFQVRPIRLMSDLNIILQAELIHQAITIQG